MNEVASCVCGLTGTRIFGELGEIRELETVPGERQVKSMCGIQSNRETHQRELLRSEPPPLSPDSLCA